MELDAQTLKETYLGRVVLFYTKAPRVQGSIKRQADTLVQTWSRPILRKPTQMHNTKIRSVNDMELSALPDDIEMGMGNGPDGEGEYDDQGQAQASQSQNQTRSQSQSESLKKKKGRRTDWSERAKVNTSSKGTRLEKAQVRSGLDREL